MSTEPERAAIAIRRARPSDAAAYARIMGDPLVLPGLQQVPYASEEGWHARLVEMGAPGKTDVLLVAERGGVVVGTAGLHHPNPSPRRRHAMLLGISVASEAHGQGVGTALMRAMVDMAERWLGVTRLELTVYVDNRIAVALYRKFGFEVEGVLRRYSLRDGHWVDAYTMARITDGPTPLAVEAAVPG